jgi:carnosine N-methyltransferase
VSTIEFFVSILLNLPLKRCHEANLYTIYPWLNQYCNNLKFENQIRSVSFPDVSPFSLPRDSQFSMVAGDFLEVYTDEGNKC